MGGFPPLASRPAPRSERYLFLVKRSALPRRRAEIPCPCPCPEVGPISFSRDLAEGPSRKARARSVAYSPTALARRARLACTLRRGDQSERRGPFDLNLSRAPTFRSRIWPATTARALACRASAAVRPERSRTMRRAPKVLFLSSNSSKTSIPSPARAAEGNVGRTGDARHPPPCGFCCGPD